MRFKALLMDETQIRRAIIRISHEILETNRGAKKLVLIGIHRRGVPLSRMIAETIKTFEGTDVPCGSLDITLYRDDFSMLTEHPMVKCTDIPFNLTGTNVIIVDDVLFTGRTTRASIEAIMEMGRPDTIQLAVLVDRGHRELPIAPNYCGKYIPTSRDEVIGVNVKDIDGKDSVDLFTVE